MNRPIVQRFAIAEQMLRDGVVFIAMGRVLGRGVVARSDKCPHTPPCSTIGQPHLWPQDAVGLALPATSVRDVVQIWSALSEVRAGLDGLFIKVVHNCPVGVRVLVESRS